ncbi:MAG: hypothetical protein D8M59_16325 [Planctomycetes bacterium]|nr:hypothetical protein [Planctomycetota bacterium]NOG54315.1 hypothetical protein [Planctomycetota bacterium]
MPSVNSVSQYLPHLLWIFSVLVLVIIVMMNVRTRWAKRRLTNEHPREFIDRVRADAKRQAPTDVRQAVAAHDEDSDSESAPSGIIPEREAERRLSSELDTKQAVLQTLIRQADERIAMLNRLLDRLPAASISPTRMAPHDAACDEPPIHTKKPSDNGAAPRVNREVPLEIKDAGQNTDSTQEPDTGIPVVPNRTTVDPLTSSVYELADRGRSPIEIARELDEQVGKVQLILALRQPA